MNIAMLTAMCVPWNDSLGLGPGAGCLWSKKELGDALADRYIERISVDNPGPHVLFIFKCDGKICAAIDGSASIGLAANISDLSLVATALESRLSRLRQWTYRLHNAAMRGTISDILAITSSLLSRSLILFDGAFNLVSFSLANGDVSSAMEETERRGYASEVSAEHQASYRKLAREHPEGFSTLYPEEERLTPVWPQPVATPAEILRLHAMKVDEGDTGAIELIRATAEELRIAVSRAGIGTESLSTSNDFVIELLTRKHPREDLRIRAEFFGWQKSELWVALRSESMDESFPPARWKQIAEKIQCQIPDIHASHADTNGMALVVPAQAALESSEMHALCTREKILIGWGDPASLESLPTSYDQAKKACATLRRTAGATMRSFDSCRLDLAMQALADAVVANDLEPLALRLVRAHDKAYGTEYATTLATLFDCGMSKTKACEKLHVHRTTLDYRLKKLKSEFHVDIEDRDTRVLSRLVLLAQGGTANSETQASSKNLGTRPI